MGFVASLIRYLDDYGVDPSTAFSVPFSAKIGGQVADPSQALARSLSVFNSIGIAVIAFGVVLFALSFFVKSWAGGVNDSEPGGAHVL